MRLLLLSLVLLSGTSIFSQSIELYGGMNYNTFAECKDEDEEIESNHTPGIGQILGLGFEKGFGKNYKLRFTFAYDMYNGKIEAYDDIDLIKADINKSIVSFGFYPIIISTYDFDISFGLVGSALLSDNIIEHEAFSNSNKELQSSPLNFNISVTFRYKIYVTEKFAIVPQVSMDAGFVPEFQNFMYDTKSDRYYFIVGLQKDF